MTSSARRVLLILGAILLTACSGSAGAGRPSDSGPVISAPPSSASPGGDSDGSVGSGIVVSPPASGDPALPGTGEPTIVVPKPGRLDVRPVGASAIEARVDGRRVAVQLTWWSGVAPCSVLDSVGQVRTGRSIVLTIVEGADQRDVACIEIAMLKATVVDLGQLEPGTYTISAGGDATPVRIVVS